jgi:hypothetical protein
MKMPRCPNKDCRYWRKIAPETVIRFGFYQTRWGKRRRYRCQTCEKTFCSNTGTPYYRLQHRRTAFDQVATLSVEGLNKSAIAVSNASAGIQSIAGWKNPAIAARCFNDKETTGFRATEFQADEIRTITQGKQQPTWIFATIEVWSRVWRSTVVGRRSYHNALALFQDAADQTNHEDIPLLTTDGFEFYERVMASLRASLYLWPGHQDASEQSDREGGTEGGDWNRNAIRGKTAAVGRLFNAEHVVYRTAEPDDPARLCLSLPEDDMSRSLEATSGRAFGIAWVLYNFVRPRRALKFGQDMRTPAVQAGLTETRLTLRQIFCFGIVLLALCEIVLRARLMRPPSFSVENGVTGGLTTLDGGSTRRYGETWSMS